VLPCVFEHGLPNIFPHKEPIKPHGPVIRLFRRSAIVVLIESVAKVQDAGHAFKKGGPSVKIRGEWMHEAALRKK
jgi:hypothetical protein